MQTSRRIKVKSNSEAIKNFFRIFLSVVGRYKLISVRIISPPIPQFNATESGAWLKDTLEKFPAWPNSHIDELLPQSSASTT
ncbi:hypothetical protein GN109_13470 [Collimonas pratensis]|nr:hypothetical protein [Collimonas pratensis]